MLASKQRRMPRPHDRRDADLGNRSRDPIEDRQLVFDRRGFGYHGTEKNDQIEHHTILPTLWNRELLSHFDFAMDGTVGAVLCNFVLDNHIQNV
jgi:hypothetical protein